MNRIFGSDAKKNGVFKDDFEKDRIQFMQELFDKLKEYGTDENVINLLKENMVCFGPNYSGSNFLVFRNMESQYSLYHKILGKK
jgi:hypothetical protein